MAYISKAQVKAKTKLLRALNKEYRVKSSFSGSDSLRLTLTIRSGEIDFIGNTLAVAKQRQKETRIIYSIESDLLHGHHVPNHYFLSKSFSGVALDYLEKAYAIMKQGHYDNIDITIDYFDCAWYNHITIGNWNNPYLLTE